jgi:replication-associated recombination protein RarA
MMMINFIVTNWKEFLLAITGLVTFASFVVKFTPSPKDDAVLMALRKLLETIALTPSQKPPEAPQDPQKPSLV